MECDLVELGVTTKFTAPVSYSIVLTEQGAYVSMPSALTTSALALDADTAPWVFEATRRLESLEHLHRNWDSYGGLPLSPQARLITFDALGWLKMRDLPIPSVVLGADGTVHLEWRSRTGRELEVGFGIGGRLEYAKTNTQGDIEEGEADAQIRENLCVLTEWLQATDA